MKKQLLFAAAALLQLQIADAQSWRPRMSGLSTNKGIIDIAAPDGLNAYAIAYDTEDWLTHLNDLTLTHDGGTTWWAQKITKLDGMRITGLGTSTGTTVHVIAWNPATGGGKAVRSLTGGATWTVQGANTFTNSASFPDDVAFLNALDGVMFGDPVGGLFEIYTTGNGGNSWTQVPAAKMPAAIATATQTEIGSTFVMEKFGNTFMTASVVYNNSDGSVAYGRLLRSDDKGKTWYVKNANLPITGWDITMKFRTNNIGLLKSNGTLYKTVDGGTTWTKVNYTGPYGVFDLDNIPGMAGAWISSGGEASVVGAGVKTGTAISYNDGLTWTKIDSGVVHTCVEMVSNTQGYTGGVSTDSRGTKGMYVYSPFKAAIEETANVETTSTEAIALTVYPNPSADVFNVTLNSPEARAAFIRVINTQGQIVSNQRIVPVGIISFGADLAAGAYTAEIIIDGVNTTFQIVKQ